MLVYNVDETGLSVVHNPSKVVAQVGHSHNVYSLTSGGKGKTHTVLSCVSASGQAMLICPRKKFVPEHFKKGAVPNTLFSNSGNGWINTDLYLKWFKFFVANIPQHVLFYLYRMVMNHMYPLNSLNWREGSQTNRKRTEKEKTREEEKREAEERKGRKEARMQSNEKRMPKS